MRSSIVRAVPLVALPLLAFCLPVPPAWAQIDTGPFAPGESWFLSGLGDGAPEPTVGASTVDLDRNGDGIPDATFNIPLAIRPTSQQNVEYRLSPSQDVLYVRVFGAGEFSPCPASTQNRIFLFHIGNAPTLTAFTGDQGVCVETPLSRQPTFHDNPARPLRTMALVSAVQPASGDQTLLWADLVGGVVNADSNSYSAVIDRIWFAPSGNAAFVVHDFDQPNKRYSLVDLCVSPFAGGQIGSVLSSGNVSAEVLAGGPTGFRMRLLDSGLPIPGSEQNLDPACFTGGPGDESCCFEGGTCSDMPATDCNSMGGNAGGSGSACASTVCPQACCNGGNCSEEIPADCSAAGGSAQGVGPTCAATNCPDPPEACCLLSGSCFETEPAFCSGTPQGPGTTCAATTCPALTVNVNVSGPLQTGQGNSVTLSVSWENSGSVEGPSGWIDFVLPQFSTFVSATGGGAPAAAGRIRWNFLSIPVGTSRQEEVTFTSPCFAGSMTSRAELWSGGLTFQSPPVVTALDPPNTNPIDISVVSVASAAPPLAPGDTITHTITLDNPNPTAHPAIKLAMLAGNDMSFDALIDAGSGAATRFDPGQFDWGGSLPANGSTQVVVRTAVDDCVVFRETSLGSNGRVEVRHACNILLGAVNTPKFGLLRSIEATIVGSNLGPAASIETIASDGTIQFVRAGNDIELEWTISNPQAFAQTLDAYVSIPAAYQPIGDPPFLNPVPPGASYDPGMPNLNPQVRWNGSLPGGQSVTVRFRITADLNLDCNTIFAPQITRDDSCSLAAGSVSLAKVAQQPTGSYLLGGNGRRVWMFRPDVDTVPQLLTCIPSESPGGIHRAANNDLWLTGHPTVRVNLDTLEADGLTRDEVVSMGMPDTSDAVTDPADGSVIFSGVSYVAGGESANIVRFDPLSRATQVIYADPPQFPPVVGGTNRLVREPNGMLGATVDRSQIFRFDPATPGSFVELSDPSSPTPISLALDTDGDYIVSSATFQPSPRPLVEIEPGSGSYTTIVPDLLAEFFSGFLEGSAVGDGGEVYLAPEFGGELYRVRRTDPVTVDTLFTGYAESGMDLEWVSGGACVDNDLDGYSSGPGCGGGPSDCDDSNADTFPGATEINDGIDNQCPGDLGAGLVDEVENLRFPDPLDPTPELCWDAQPLATGYESIRSTGPAFVAGCARRANATTCESDTGPDPAPGQAWYYLVRATAPASGSWGRDSASSERGVSCP